VAAEWARLPGFIALNLLGNATMSIPAAVYRIIMFVTAGVFTWWLKPQGPGAVGGG
jgi:hypothetical protein